MVEIVSAVREPQFLPFQDLNHIFVVPRPQETQVALEVEVVFQGFLKALVEVEVEAVFQGLLKTISINEVEKVYQDFLVGVEVEGVFRQIERGQERLGIDLKTRGHEVRKLMFAGFSTLIHSQGYDPEEVLQEVYMGIEVRNRGKCPWDPRISSFGHYVHMVIGCILRNYHRKESVRRSHLVMESSLENQNEDFLGVDSLASTSGSEILPEESLMCATQNLAEYMSSFQEELLVPSLQIMPHLLSGRTREEMVGLTGFSKSLVGRCVTWIRDRAAEWGGRVSKA